jgi:hypothetical protein
MEPLSPAAVAELRRRRLAHLEQRDDDEERRRDAAQAARLGAFLGPAALAYATNAQAAPNTGPEAQPAPIAPATRSSVQPARQPSVPPEPAAPAERVCRICFGGPEAGVLFSPCRCRGTSRFVHVSCLAAWRTISVGRSSFHACDVCGFRYNTRRASWAPYLELQSPALVLAALMLSLLVVAVSALAHVFQMWSGTNLSLLFYLNVRWLPPWHGGWLHQWFQPATARRVSQLDALVSGVVLCGVAGTALSALRRYRRDPQAFWSVVAPAVGSAFLSAGTPALRIFVVGGLSWGFAAMAHSLKVQSRRLITRCGEIVLDEGAT